jgi:nitrate/nitrite transporter NarK
MLLGNVVLDIVGPLLIVGFGWRFTFISFAAVGIVVSFAFLRFGKEPLSRGEQRKNVTIREMLSLFRHRVMWVCGVIQYIRLAVARGIEFWLPSLLVDEKGLSLQLTGLIIAVRFVLISPSNILGGYVSDRLRNPTVVIGFSLIILAITTGLFIVIDNIIALVVVIFINAVFVQMYFGPLFTVPIEMLGTRTAGISRGFSNFFANLGSLSFIYLLGVLKDITGSFDSGYCAIVVACVIGLVFTVLLEKMRRKAIMPTT